MMKRENLIVQRKAARPVAPRRHCGRLVRAIVLLMLASTVSVGAAKAANYPERPVHIIVSAAAGGGTDTLARLFGMKLAAKWGQPVIVENRPGASATIGTNYVAQAAPDGYTLMLIGNPLTVPKDF